MDQSIASQNDPNVLIVPEESALILIESPRRNGARHSQTTWRQVMTSIGSSEAAKEVVRRNTEEVQSGGNFEVFDELFADDFLDHTPQPGRTPDKEGARQLYKSLRSAFPDFYADIHWQVADGDRVTTYKTYYGTHQGEFLGVAPTGREIQFETVDVMRVHNGKSPNTGAWRISSRSCSSSARSPPGKNALEGAGEALAAAAALSS